MRITSTLPATLLVAVSIGLLLGGCGMLRSSRLARDPAAQARQYSQTHMRPVQAAPVANGGNGVIEKVPFQVGVSSATVEKLAREAACTGGEGASLLTQEGPVEVYRMQCDNGKTFMARCELRQCKPM